MGTRTTYTAEDVAAGFAGAVTFSPAAAARVAEAITAAEPDAASSPDQAAKRVQHALFTATATNGNDGARASIDTCGLALARIRGRRQLAAAASTAGTSSSGDSGEDAGAGGASGY